MARACQRSTAWLRRKLPYQALQTGFINHRLAGMQEICRIW